MKKSFIVLFIFLFLITALHIYSESLWDDRATDIYNRKVYYNVGDPIKIVIDERSSMEYRASSKSLKNYQLNVTGGEMSGLLSFVPTANVQENKSGQERDNLSIQNVIQGRITNITDNYVTIRGSKSIGVNNKVNTIIVFGDANFSDIDGNTIYSDMLINPTFRITTLLDNDRVVITDDDLISEILSSESTGEELEITKLSEEKKKEILLGYFNKVLNVLF